MGNANSFVLLVKPTSRVYLNVTRCHFGRLLISRGCSRFRWGLHLLQAFTPLCGVSPVWGVPPFFQGGSLTLPWCATCTSRAKNVFSSVWCIFCGGSHAQGGSHTRQETENSDEVSPGVKLFPFPLSTTPIQWCFLSSLVEHFVSHCVVTDKLGSRSTSIQERIQL